MYIRLHLQKSTVIYDEIIDLNVVFTHILSFYHLFVLVSSSTQVFDSYYPSTLNGHKNPSLNDVHFNDNIIPSDKSAYTESDLQAARNLSYAELPLHYDVKVQTTLSNLDYTDMIDSGTQTQFSAIDGEELRKFLDSIDNIDLEMSDGKKCKAGSAAS